MEAHVIRSGERLELEVASSVAALVSATARVVDRNGRVLDVLRISERLTGSSRALEGSADGWFSEPASHDGFVVDAVMNLGPSTAAVKRGQTFARLSIGPSAGGVLCKGYLYPLHVVSQGEFTEPGPGGGEGFIRNVQPANPAAGARSTTTVPTNAIWRVHGAGCTFQAAAVAGDRHPDAGVGNGQAWVNAAIDKPFTTGQLGEIFFNRGQGHQTIPTSTYGHRIGAFPDTIALEGDIVYVGADQMNVADQITLAAFRIEEWLVV